MKIKKVSLIILFIIVILFLCTTLVFATGISDTVDKPVNGYLNIIKDFLIIPILPVISTFIIVLLKKKTSEISQNIKNDEIKKYINIAEDAVYTAVTAVTQTYVMTLKKENAFTEEAQEEAFETAKAKSLLIMGQSAQEALELVYGDLNEWLNNKIEYYVNISKSYTDRSDTL